MEKTTDCAMSGIRIYRTGERDDVPLAPNGVTAPWPLLPNGEKASHFSWYFKSILAELDAYYWLLDGAEGFDWLWEDSPWARRINELIGNGPDGLEDDAPGWEVEVFRHGPHLMSEIAPYVRNDWNWLYGFTRLPTDPAHVLSLIQQGGDRDPALLKQVDVLFENSDGCFWTFYARDESLLEKVRVDMSMDPRVRIEVVTHREIHK